MFTESDLTAEIRTKWWTVQERLRRLDWRHASRSIAITLTLASLFVVEPAIAQQASEQNAICQAEKLPEMIEGFFQITTGLGVMGLVVVWQADSLAEMFMANPKQKKGLKQHKRSALKSGLVLTVLGPLYTVAGPMMGLPLADCINLSPW